MAAFSHNGEPGSALDAELKGHDTRHMEGYSAGFKAGRKAGMRDVQQIAAEHAAHFSGDEHEAWQDGYIAAAKSILSAISKGE